VKTARRLAVAASLLASGLASARLLAQGSARASTASAPLKAAVPKDALGSALDALIPTLMNEGDVPGLAIVVVREARVFWHRNFGVRDSKMGTPIDDETVFEAASLSKPVFAYMVLKLVDAGVIDLDTPIVKYLPGDYVVEDPRFRSITPRQVLTHQAGFPNWRSGQDVKIAFPPGERFSYSGEGFVYLQKAVERATGQTLDRLSKRLVFEPLQMTSSSFVWEDRFEGRKATGHDAAGAPKRLEKRTEAVSAASLHTTALDFSRFLIAALEGSGLEKKTHAEMIRPQVQVDEGCSNCTSRKPTGRPSREIAWGLGWGLEETEDGTDLWHWGDNGSGFHCYVVGYPRQRMGVAVFTNGLGGHGIIPDAVTAAVGGRHPSYGWIRYERYNSPARTWMKDVAARGDAAIASYRERKRQKPDAALSEEEVNEVGYWLLARKKVKEAIAVFEMNVSDFPSSWNTYDSLGEACAEDGQKQRAIAMYEKSIALNPENSSGVEMLRKLKSATPTPTPSP
jgi:CubicO group peptidase (beta-lactamase class C family)